MDNSSHTNFSDTDLSSVLDRTTHGFYVVDDGHGISASDRDRVFEAGYSTEDEGTGLGLRIVEQIVAAHGWSITATNSAAGGARFEISDVEYNQ